MGDLVNLKQRRKQAKREADDKAAAENRIKFGISKAKKNLTKAQQVLSDKSLDGHKRDSDGS